MNNNYIHYPTKLCKFHSSLVYWLKQDVYVKLFIVAVYTGSLFCFVFPPYHPFSTKRDFICICFLVHTNADQLIIVCRGKPPSVSQSMSVLDLSGKGKSAKPARRLSIPTKSTVTPAPKSVGSITPISEVKSRRSTVTQAKSDTPVSDVSKSSSRKKFAILSSASYWLNQIKLSESAAKHSISLAFFKLAFEARCEVH